MPTVFFYDQTANPHGARCKAATLRHSSWARRVAGDWRSPRRSVRLSSRLIGILGPRQINVHYIYIPNKLRIARQGLRITTWAALYRVAIGSSVSNVATVWLSGSPDVRLSNHQTIRYRRSFWASIRELPAMTSEAPPPSTTGGNE